MHINESKAVEALRHEATNAILLQRMVQRSEKLSTMLVTILRKSSQSPELVA